MIEEIVRSVREQGEPALRRWSEQFGDLEPDAPLVRDREELERARRALPEEDRALLERVAQRIERFARAQRDSLRPIDMAVPGGRAGHEVVPIERAGCYAPGGRYPLPSSVLMTAVTARVAGVRSIWVASPKPSPVTLAAAAIAGVDGVLAVGGAQAIAAMAYGVGMPRRDIIVGPGNRYVTAAKQLVSADVAIDMPAGPSELVVLADASADPRRVAADLLAQAEHDPEARPILLTESAELIGRVEAELTAQLATLPTATVARAALANGRLERVEDERELVARCNEIAPEHLAIHRRRTPSGLLHYGTRFEGENAAEVFGDYGAGPNHVLPTGGRARMTGGLSVLTFLRVRTWMRGEERDPDLIRDTARLARLEGLEAHARAAEMR
ncbi:MAG: histidinol dehydrogenase [Planctomycetota bacterium]